MERGAVSFKVFPGSFPGASPAPGQHLRVTGGQCVPWVWKETEFSTIVCLTL